MDLLGDRDLGSSRARPISIDWIVVRLSSTFSPGYDGCAPAMSLVALRTTR
jgi:hypothetical protein